MNIYFEKTSPGSLDFIQKNLIEYFSIYAKMVPDLYRGADVSISNFIGSVHNNDYFFKKNKVNILIQPIDGTVIKKVALEAMNKFDLIITPANPGKEIMLNNGVTAPIEVIPNFFKDYDIKRREKKNDKITFYHESTLIQRKNFKGLYREFLFAFANSNFYKKVKLVIKTTSPIEEYKEFIETMNSEFSEFMPEIEIISKYMNEIELAELWEKMDCYVSFSHMEGFGIPLLNFAALKKPIITLRSTISGYMDFLNDDNCYFVDSKTFLTKGNLIFDDNSVWEDVDERFEECSNIFKNLVSDFERGECRLVNSEDLKIYRFQHVQQQYLKRIFALAGEQIPEIHENPLERVSSIDEKEYEERPIEVGMWPEDWPVCGEPIYWESTVNAKPVHLYINYYKRPERQLELDRCLIKNVENKFIDKIFVAVEPGVKLPLSNPKIQVIEYEPDPSTGYHSSLSFKRWFELASEFSGSGVIKIICNSDVYFDNTVEILKTLDMTGKCFSLTRWNEDRDESIELFNCIGSQDAWIFSDDIKLDAPFGMGIPGCDQKIARELYDKGILVSNPCRTIRCIHVHASQLRWWKYPLHQLGPTTTMGVRHGEIIIDSKDTRPKLALMGLARGCAISMNKLIESMQPIFERFNCVGWVSCGDRATANLINNSSYPLFVLPDIKKTQEDNRYSHLAKIRNSVLNAVRASDFKPDYYLSVDMDSNRLVDFAGLESLLSNSNWSAVSVLGIMPYHRVRSFHIGPLLKRDDKEYVYYDTLALETTDKTRYIWSTAGQWYSHGSGFDPDTNFKAIAPPLNFDSWQEVNSAFGPATFYRASAIENLNYDENVKQCEHQEFHLKMTGKHFIANDIVWEY